MESSDDSSTVRVVDVPIALIDPSPSNPRRKLRGIEELAASIAAYGLLQALVVRPVGGRYDLVAGHRRLAAVQLLGWETVSAHIRETADDEASVLTLVENLQRNDLSPREEAHALEVLLRERGWSTRQVAAAVYRSAAYVSKRLRVFEDPVLAPLVLERRLATSSAEELLVLKPPMRTELAKRAANEGWDHPRVREAVRTRFGSKRRRPMVHGLAHQLRQHLQGVFPAQLTETDRRELRLLFRDLAVLARAPSSEEQPQFPPLPD
jgi:ParB/RepB/Spo0J family partition protein